MIDPVWRQHNWLNWLQTSILLMVLIVISGFAGRLIFGEQGIWVAPTSAVLVVLITPVSAWRLTLRLYQATPIEPRQAPVLWQILETLAARAELPRVPELYYLPTPIINAFSVGVRKRAAIALSDGLLQSLSLREIQGVMAHEIAHIASNDTQVMALADVISRITALFASAGQLLLIFSIPLLLFSNTPFQLNWAGILVLLFSPHMALLAQLGLSRNREYNADLNAVHLTGDALGLAKALVHVEQASQTWLALLLPGMGNPQPSWLRSHPPTEQRIRRLLSLSQQNTSQDWRPVDHHAMYFKPVNRKPRWRIGGLWR
jgi:heat shock protein HtpX